MTLFVLFPCGQHRCQAVLTCSTFTIQGQHVECFGQMFSAPLDTMPCLQMHSV